MELSLGAYIGLVIYCGLAGAAIVLLTQKYSPKVTGEAKKPKKRVKKVKRAGKLTILRRNGKMVSFNSVTDAAKFLNRQIGYVEYLARSKRAEPNTGYKVEIVRK